MKKIVIVLTACLGLAGCFGSGTEATQKAQELLELVRQGCGVVPRLADLVDVVTSSRYEGATSTAKFICDQVSQPQSFGLFGSEGETENCIAVVNDICVRESVTEDGE